MQRNALFTPDTPIVERRDWAAVIEHVPSASAVRGVFIDTLVRLLSKQAWDHLRPTLRKPPRTSGYAPFGLVPGDDFLRIVFALAEEQRPDGATLGEALRGVARRDMDTFASTTLGRVVLATAGDAESALLRLPTVYNAVAPGPEEVRAERFDARCVRIRFDDPAHVWPYQLGQIEGIVLHFATYCRITVDEDDAGAWYAIEHAPA